jgi:hypothetical protein
MDNPRVRELSLLQCKSNFGEQADDTRSNIGSLFLNDVVIMTKPQATLFMAQVRQAVGSVDPNLPPFPMRPLKEQVAGTFRQQRLIARLTSFLRTAFLSYHPSASTASPPTTPAGASARLACAWR